MTQILLVEDSLDSQLLVSKTLAPQYSVTCAGTISSALDILKQNTFELILLDVSLPDGDGFKLCAQLQKSEKNADAAIIFLTAKSNIADKVMGFSLGAEDYIVKPFEPLELRARVEAKLRKVENHRKYAEQISKGGIKINVPVQKAFILSNNRELELALTPIEFKLLFHFFRNEQQILSRENLIHAIWGEHVVMTDRTVDKHISSLREKLLEKSQYIETIPRTGYRFSANISLN